MNKKRRDKLKEAISYIQKSKSVVLSVKLEEEFAYDSIPENLQYSNKGCDMEENIDNMDEVITTIDDIIESINDIIR